MSQGSFVARYFLIAGGTLAGIGLVLWLALPIPMSFPPYLPTAVLALGYGLVALRARSAGGDRKS